MWAHLEVGHNIDIYVIVEYNYVSCFDVCNVKNCPNTIQRVIIYPCKTPYVKFICSAILYEFKINIKNNNYIIYIYQRLATWTLFWYRTVHTIFSVIFAHLYLLQIFTSLAMSIKIKNFLCLCLIKKTLCMVFGQFFTLQTSKHKT